MLTNDAKHTKKRVNQAIANIRLIATRVKRASILEATQRAEIVVNFLNAFRQYLNAAEINPDWMGKITVIKHDQETLADAVQATFQADSVYNLLARINKKKYEQEYRQVWHILENIHSYLETVIKNGGNNA